MFELKTVENLGVILFLVFCLTLCQDRILVANDNLDNNSTLENNIPESLLIRMKDVQNITELLNFVAPENVSSVGSNQSYANESRRALAAVSRTSIAQPANCQPQQQVIELDRPENGATMFWPSCVLVRRCGGCCPSKMLACKPLTTSIVNVTVLQLHYNHQNPDNFESQGTRIFALEQHDRCACACREQQEDCNPDVHDYRASECKCVCKTTEEADSCSGPEKIWDSRDCLCKCRNVRVCSSGLFFNILTCKCEVVRRSLASEGLSLSNSSLHLSSQISAANST